MKQLKVVLMSLLLVLVFSGNAHAGGISILVVKFLTWLGGSGSFAAIKGALYVAMVAASAYSMYKQNQLSKRRGGLDDNFGGILVNSRSGTETLHVVYGEVRKGGNQVYFETGGNENEELRLIQTIGEGPIDAYSIDVTGEAIGTGDGIETAFDLVNVNVRGTSLVGYVDSLAQSASLVSDQIVFASPPPDQSVLTADYTHETDNVTVYLNDLLSTDPRYDGYVTTQIKYGDPNQDATTTLPDDPMRFTAYIKVWLKYSQNKFQGIPLITYKVKGLRIFDPRNGNHTAGDLSTYEWSDNVALVVLDVMTNARYGLGFPFSVIDLPSFIDAANFCDQPYTNEPSFSFTFNGVLNASEPAGDVINRIMLNMRGYLLYSEGMYKLKYYNYNTPVMHIGPDDIVDDSFQFSIPGLPETPNKLKVSFIDPEQKYTISDFTFEDQEAITIDGMERENEINLIGTTSYKQATRLAVHLLERQRLNKVFNCTINSKGMALEAGDSIAVTYDLPGWIYNEQTDIDKSGRICSITEIRYNPDYSVTITFIEEDVDLYDQILNISPHTYFSSTFLSPWDAPSSVTNVDFSELQAQNKDLTYVRLQVDFTPPASTWFDYVEVHISFNGADYRYLTSATRRFYVDPAEIGVTYYLKFFSVAMSGAMQTEAEADVYSHFVEGDAFVPVWPAGAEFIGIVAGDSINFRWTAIPDIDLAGYRIKRGDTTWESGVEVAFIKTISFMAVGVKPGDHRFMIKGVNTLGNESAMLYTHCEVFLPAGYNPPTPYLVTATDDVIIDTGQDAWTPQDANINAGSYAPDGPLYTIGAHVRIGILNPIGAQALAYENFSPPISFCNATHIGFWFRTNIAITEGQVRLVISQNNAIPSFPRLETLYVPEITTLDTWIYINLQLANPQSCDNVQSIGFETSDSFPVCEFRVDDVRATDGAHYNTMWDDYGVGERILKVKGLTQAGEPDGYWESKVYDIGAAQPMRFWSDYELTQSGNELRWDGKFSPTDTWLKFAANQTWENVFSATASSGFSMEFSYSIDNVIWEAVPFFHIYSVEVKCRYVKYRVYIHDESEEVYLYVRSLALIRSYW